MNIPSGDVFETHGLYDIDVDLTGIKDLGQSSSGWAHLRPTSDYPLLSGSPTDFTGRTVRFYWCSTDDRDAARQFRRCSQIWAIDSLARQDDEECPIKERRQAIAWWEHDGLWLITDEPKEEVVSLGQWWAARLSEQQSPDQVNGNVESEVEVYKRDSGGQIYADLCDLFVSLARCNKVRIILKVFPRSEPDG